MSLFLLAKPFLHALDPERAHGVAIASLKHGVAPLTPEVKDEALTQTICGLTFANPVGLAAGFDKNAEAMHGLARQGFGFIEVGTCTLKAQSGNPKPRIFRIPEQEAIVNRLGFNNGGADAYVANLQKRPQGLVVGANIGKNKTSEDAVADYATMVERVHAHCDYITVNISSPNTEGLRDLQKGDALRELLEAVKNTLARVNATVPVFVKMAPDVDEAQMDHLAKMVLGTGMDGLIVSNTTIARPEFLSPAMQQEVGGLSGKPLMDASTEVLRSMAGRIEGKVPLIGVGGIASAEDAYRKICAGASLVQIYSAFVYQGFGLVRDINLGLLELLKRDGYKHISEAIGVYI